MPPGRSRPTKRSSSSSSYKSTITTIIFVALCVIGVWMLSSNSIVPPHATTRASKPSPIAVAKNIAVATSSITAADADLASSGELPQSGELVTKKDQPIFEDNPGDLPVDAIESDDLKGSNENDKEQKQETNAESSNAEENSESLTGKESDEEQEKQSEKHTQVSEESLLMQSQQADETSHEKPVVETEGSIRQITDEESNNNQEQSTIIDGGDTSYEVKKSDEEQTLQQQDIEIVKSSDESQSQISIEEQRVQEAAESNVNTSQESQELKSFEEQPQQQQRQEDAGIQTETQESENQVTEEDQQQRMEEQQQQQQQQKKQDKSLNDENQQQAEKQAESVFGDETSPAIELIDKQSESVTSTQVENQETQQESQSENNQDTTAETTPNSGIPKESRESKKSWSTQATESENQKERHRDESVDKENMYGYNWELCNVTAGPDYIPCLDNEKALRQLHTTGHFEHRERHCPEESPTCLVPPPENYKRSIPWPGSRDKIWYHNVPRTTLAKVKGHQNWVKVTGEFLTFPGGGTQFIHGALHYIDFIQKAVPKIAWGKHTRVILDVGCGVASFGGYLFDKDVLTMSFAPKDEHEAQVQFALERGIPAISAVMGSQRLPFPSRVFDIIHCARCRVPWHAEGGMLLLELNRVLRPGGYFVWSATPVYQKVEEDVEIWRAMSALTVSMCWELVTIQKDKLNSIGAAIYRKPISNDCYDQRKHNKPPMCKNDDDANAAWYVPLQACMHRIPVEETERGSRWPENWPQRVNTPPYWLNSSQMGIYGRPAPQDFESDYRHWKNVVTKSYMTAIGISWENVRNVMDMRAVYGGFAAALKNHQVWVMNIVNIDSPDTLPIIYERGLFGIYHDWCESFSTYPRTYDLLHADHLFSKLKTRCRLPPVLTEVDRIVRPGGKLIVRDESSAIGEVENILKSLRWEVHLTFSKDQEGLLSAQKGDWRPLTFSVSS